MTALVIGALEEEERVRGPLRSELVPRGGEDTAGEGCPASGPPGTDGPVRLGPSYIPALLIPLLEHELCR